MSWKRLHQTYTKNGIFLALGAGVSIDSKLPNWQSLLQRLISNHSANTEHDLFNDLEHHGLSLPAIASLLEEYSTDRDDFVEKVREALYENFSYYPGGVTKSNRRGFVNSIHKMNPTLRSVASLCATRQQNSRVYNTNPRIHAIVTFNLDALLQAYVYARYEKRLLRTIERPSASRRPDKINIYHMHGLLRFDRKARDRSKEAPDSVVLTEQDYFDFFNESTSLFNYTFLYLLREYSCMFIGLSMQDENIRRLLHYPNKERLLAYKREGKTSIRRDKFLRHYAVLKRSKKAHVDKAIEDTLDPLGTRVLWVDDYDEIPARLKLLYESVGEKWDDVF